jgi:hypothetical protein
MHAASTTESKVQPAKEALYLSMEQELAAYNRALRAGKKPPMPQYDPEEFRAFRDWQQDRLAESNRQHYGR